MRTYTMIQTDIWVEEEFLELSEDSRFLLLYLFTTPHSTSLGCFRIPIDYIASDLQWSTERVSKALYACQTSKFLEFSRNGWLFVPKVLEWNRNINANQWKNLKKLFDQIPQKLSFYGRLIELLLRVFEGIPSCDQEELKGLLEETRRSETILKSFQNPSETLSKPFTNPTETIPEGGQNHHSGTISEQPKANFQNPSYTLQEPFQNPSETLSNGIQSQTQDEVPEVDLDRIDGQSQEITTENPTPFETVSEPFRNPSETLSESFRIKEQRTKNKEYRTKKKEQGTQNQEQEEQNPEQKKELRTENQEKNNVAQARQLSRASPSQSSFASSVDAVFSHWQKMMNHPSAKLDDKRKSIIRKALKMGYSVDDLQLAISGCAATPYNMGDNPQGQRYDGLHVILRDADQIDRFIANHHKPPRPLTKADMKTQENLRNGQTWFRSEMARMTPKEQAEVFPEKESFDLEEFFREEPEMAEAAGFFEGQMDM